MKICLRLSYPVGIPWIIWVLLIKDSPRKPLRWRPMEGRLASQSVAVARYMAAWMDGWMGELTFGLRSWIGCIQIFMNFVGCGLTTPQCVTSYSCFRTVWDHTTATIPTTYIHCRVKAEYHVFICWLQRILFRIVNAELNRAWPWEKSVWPAEWDGSCFVRPSIQWMNHFPMYSCSIVTQSPRL